MSNHPLAQNTPEQALSQVQQQMQSAVDGAVDAVEKGVTQAKERVGESLAHARDKAIAAKDQLGAGMENVLENSKQSFADTASKTKSLWRRMGVAVTRWFDTAIDDTPVSIKEDKLDLARTLPFIGVHLMCLGVFFVGFSWVAVAVAVLMYVVRMFAVTGFYHRYFAQEF
jgi:hypothetical protein